MKESGYDIKSLLFTWRTIMMVDNIRSLLLFWLFIFEKNSAQQNGKMTK
jgi:hypothetical protein